MSAINRARRPWIVSPLLRAFQELKNDPAAVNEVLTRSAARHPDDPQVLSLLAGHKFHERNFEEAATLFSRALAIIGADKTLYTALAACRERQHRFEEAIEWRERIAAEFPPSPYNAHLLSGLRGAFEARASAHALAELYDELATGWDRQYVRDRGFRLASDGLELLQSTGVRLTDQVVVDLGCGTGAVGESATRSGAVVYGVDISERMLNAARAKAAYAGLIHADLEPFLVDPGKYFLDERWDTVVALDVFIHFDDLERLFKAVRTQLERGGHFLLSVRHDETVSPTTRFTRFAKYVHTKEEVLRWLESADFKCVSARECVVYTWSHYTVQGSLFVARAR